MKEDGGKNIFVSLFPIYLPHFKTVLSLPLPPSVLTSLPHSYRILSIPFIYSLYSHSLHLILATVESWVSPCPRSFIRDCDCTGYKGFPL